MPDSTLSRIRNKIRTRQYIVSLHADDEMDADGFTLFDIEAVILSGNIMSRQKDRDTGEWKYLIRGTSLTGTIAIAVAKFGVTGKLVIITVYGE